jgi:mannose-1-phosphate guanylyltransferase
MDTPMWSPLPFEKRPWGTYRTVFEQEFAPGHHVKIKKIIVKPGKRLSLQYHKQRAEHWFCIQGRGTVTIGDNEIQLWPGGHVDIMPNEKHRIECEGVTDLIFIEIQTGDYLGEDDIVRLEDDYGR